MVKKFLLSFTLIFTFVIYALHLQKEDSGDGQIVTPNVSPAAESPSPALNQQDLQSPEPSPSTRAIISNKFKDGQFIGDVSDAYYGNVQIQVTIQNGAIADVNFLQYPNDRSNSREISSRSMPILKQETIRAQNANVDVVSGATDTSVAFIQSLSSILAGAKN